MIDEITELMIIYTNNFVSFCTFLKLNFLYKYWKTVENLFRNKLMNISSKFIYRIYFIQAYIEIIGSSQVSNLISRALYQALHTNKPIY